MEPLHEASSVATNPTGLEAVQPGVDTMASLPVEKLDSASVALSESFVGRWQKLVSQTNWEKGKIIAEWRATLIAEKSPVTAYSDESWARQVGDVTSQHVGRLRRVYERFGESQSSYEGLYWSHFLAALDWDDAELWLEGAARSDWSVSQMRRTRSEAMGGDHGNSERDEELITSELDDGFVGLALEEDRSAGMEHDEDEEIRSERDSNGRIESGPLAEGPDFGDEESENIASYDSSDSSSGPEESFENAGDQGNPFAELGPLPPDVADALEQFKLCVIRHRSANWGDFSQSKMVQVLEALRSFASR
ncbi:MAG: hypothetical protein FJ308_04885 [Planctomycetes bacterium]|nr:hypothetical protein [Planctomycetota bacterium]